MLCLKVAIARLVMKGLDKLQGLAEVLIKESGLEVDDFDEDEVGIHLKLRKNSLLLV